MPCNHYNSKAISLWAVSFLPLKTNLLFTSWNPAQHKRQDRKVSPIAGGTFSLHGALRFQAALSNLSSRKQNPPKLRLERSSQNAGKEQEGYGRSCFGRAEPDSSSSHRRPGNDTPGFPSRKDPDDATAACVTCHGLGTQRPGQRRHSTPAAPKSKFFPKGNVDFPVSLTLWPLRHGSDHDSQRNEHNLGLTPGCGQMSHPIYDRRQPSRGSVQPKQDICVRSRPGSNIMC